MQTMHPVPLRWHSTAGLIPLSVQGPVHLGKAVNGQFVNRQRFSDCIPSPRGPGQGRRLARYTGCPPCGNMHKAYLLRRFQLGEARTNSHCPKQGQTKVAFLKQAIPPPSGRIYPILGGIRYRRDVCKGLYARG